MSKEVLSTKNLGGLPVGPVDDISPTINIMVYGEPGVGKTVLAGSAAAVEQMGPVLFVDIEGGTLSLRHTYPDVDVVRVQSFNEMGKLFAELRKGQSEYRTIVLDSLTEIQKFGMYDIMQRALQEDDSRDPDLPGIGEWGKNSLTLDTEVLTPRGWTKMGSLVVGSEVIGSDGKVTKVTAIYPEGFKDVYRVTFNDGTEAECTADHLWTVRDTTGGNRHTFRTLRTDTIAKLRKQALPQIEPAEFEEKKLPVHPYLLGLYLADGSSSRAILTYGSLSGEAIEVAEQFLPEGHSFERYGDGASWVLKSAHRSNQWADETNLVRQGLRELGLWNLRWPDKFIPEQYMLGSIEQRLLLLQGLMDGDGSCRSTGAQYSTSTDRLANQMHELVSSLGGKASITRVEGGCHNVRVRLPEQFNPFLVPRKRDAYNPPRNQLYRTIESIEYAGRKDTQCISVEAEDGLYAIQGYILAHNTEQMRRLVRAFRDLPMNVIFTALVREEKDRGKTFVKPGLSAKLSGEVAGFLDIVSFMYVREVDGEMKRLLATVTTETMIGKDRTGMLPQVIESPTMQKIWDHIYGEEDPEKVLERSVSAAAS